VPTKRALNKGIPISPDIHKSKKSMQISFSTPNGIEAEALNFSTLKITKVAKPN
jgi:hypothetical protein